MIAERIPENVCYSEKEFNLFPNTRPAFDDAAEIRRELYDYFPINRDENGKDYQLNPESPSVEKLPERYCRYGIFGRNQTNS